MEITKKFPGGMAMSHGKAIDETLNEEVELMSSFSGSPIIKFDDGSIVLIPWKEVVRIADEFRKELSNGTATNI